MDASDFLAVPDELQPAALQYFSKLEADGYKVAREPLNIAYPRTPVFIAKRRPTTVIFEVYSALRFAEIREWARYGQTCSSDTRLIVGLTETAPATPNDMAILKELRCGLWMIGSGEPFEAIPAHDLALNVQLPDLPTGLKRLLGGAYEHFDRGQWREGFEEACQMFEQEARSYLKLHMSRGRITLSTPKGKRITVSQVAKMPMGALAETFGRIPTPSAIDTRVEQALLTINTERVSVAHYKGRREAALRRKVRSHMFVIVNSLRLIKSIPN